MPDEIDLSPEQEAALDRAWAKLDEIHRLEEQGQGPPRWDVDRAMHECPSLTRDEAEEWVRIANEVYQRLRLERVAASVADEQSLLAANEHFSTRRA